MEVKFLLLYFILTFSLSIGDVAKELAIKRMSQCIQRQSIASGLDSFELEQIVFGKVFSVHDLHIMGLPKWRFEALKFDATFVPLSVKRINIRLRWDVIAFHSPHYKLNISNIIQGEGAMLIELKDVVFEIKYVKNVTRLQTKLSAGETKFEFNGLKLKRHHDNIQITKNNVQQKPQTCVTQKPVKKIDGLADLNEILLQLAKCFPFAKFFN